MTRLPFRSHSEQQVLLAACATSSRPAAAAHLGRRRDRDRVVGFADVAALPDPEWAGAAPGRYTVAGLVPGGQLVAVPLLAVPLLAEPEPAEPEPAAPVRVLDDIATVTADVAAVLKARPELLHNHALLMALAPVVAMLKGQVA